MTGTVLTTGVVEAQTTGVVEAQTTNDFKMKIDKFWQDELFTTPF